MTLKLSGVGAEPKKLMFLGAVVIVGIWVWYLNRTPSGSTDSSRTTVIPGVSASAGRPAATRPNARLNRRAGRGQSSLQEFRPSLKRKSGEEIDRSNIDPTLRLDLLEKLQNVKLQGGTRSLFEASNAPVEMAKLVKEPPKVIPKMVGPMPAAAPVKPVETPPPIPLKFYGFISPHKSGSKRAFFMDGEEIFIASEGELVKNRYKIVRIGVNSVVVEDTQVKNNQQTLPLVEEQTG